jgi:Tfp pilus assembly protein PilF
LANSHWSGRMMIAAGALSVITALLPGGCASKRAGGPEAAQQVDVRRSAAMALAMQAQQAEKAGELDRAIDLYRQALDGVADPPAQWWNNLGALLLEKGQSRYMDAAAAFKAAAAIDLTDPRPRVNLGLVYHKAGYGVKAMEYFEEALRLDQYNLDALRGALTVQ